MLLLTAALFQQVRYVGRAVLPAQDVVDTVSVAQRIEREGLPATMRAEPVPPLFPSLVAAMHGLLSRCGIVDGHDWVRPPQVVAALALILAVIPVFALARRRVGHDAAVVAAIFFISLPAVARLGGDGLGDALHVCLAAWSAWLLMFAVDGSRTAAVAAGLCLAGALLIRAEAIVLPLAMLLLAVRRCEYCLPGFFAAAAVCVVPYVAVGVTSPNEIAVRLRGGAAPTEDAPLNEAGFWFSQGGSWLDSARGLPLTFGHKDRTRSSRFHGFVATVREFVDEGLMAGGYVLPIFALAGWLIRRRRETTSYDALVLVAVALQLVIMFGMAWRNGYLSTRHFLLPVMLTLPYAGSAIVAATTAFRNKFGDSGIRRAAAHPGFAVGVFAVAAIIASARPLHESNLAHRQAAQWLQTVAAPGNVLEQHGYTALMTGRTTFRFDAAETAFFDADLRYVLIERGDLEADSPRGRSLRTMLGDSARAIETFVAPRGRTQRDVLVFTRPPWNFASREKIDAR